MFKFLIFFLFLDFSLCQNQRNDPFTNNLVISSSNDAILRQFNASLAKIAGDFAEQGKMYGYSDTDIAQEFLVNQQLHESYLVDIEMELKHRLMALAAKLESTIDSTDERFKNIKKLILRFIQGAKTVSDYPDDFDPTLHQRYATLMRNKFWQYQDIQIKGILKNTTLINVHLKNFNDLFRQHEATLDASMKNKLQDISRRMTTLSNLYMKYASKMGRVIINMVTVFADVQAESSVQCIWAPSCGDFFE
jgi:hypothetical protein